jgi:hypothetical protein
MLDLAVREKIEDLVRRSSQIALRGERLEGREHIAACHSWITEALNIIDFAVPTENNIYSRAIKQRGRGGNSLLNNVITMGSILSSLLADIDAGLIADFGNKIRAETFDEFLEHADLYRQEGQNQAAGVLAGVVFEDTIRRICRDNGITEKGEDLDKLISALTSRTVITGQQARQARTAAFVRTKATHAQWDDYDLDGVADVIRLTRTLLAEHLGG